MGRCVRSGGLDIHIRKRFDQKEDMRLMKELLHVEKGGHKSGRIGGK